MQAIIKQAAVPDIFGVGFILVNGNGHRLIALTDILIFTLLILFLRQKKHDVLLAVGKLVTVLQLSSSNSPNRFSSASVTSS